MAKSPRKPPRKPIVEKVTIRRRSDQSYRYGVPDNIHMLIGRAVVMWTGVEQAIEEIIWTFMRVSVEEGRIITASLDFNHKLMLLRKLAQHHTEANMLPRILDAIIKTNELYSVRNDVVHGRWITILPDNTPGVLSLKEKLPDGTPSNEIMCTEMPAGHLVVFINNCIKANNFLITFRQQLDALRNKPL